MELAILTAQRREDLAACEFRRRADSKCWVKKDTLFIAQQKTGAKITVPTSLRIAALGSTLKEVVSYAGTTSSRPGWSTTFATSPE